MIKRVAIIIVFYLLDCWLYEYMCRHIPGWFPAPGRIAEGVILLGGLLLLISVVALQILLWRKLKLHLPDEPKRRWDSGLSTGNLPGQKEKHSPAEAKEEQNYNFLIHFLLIALGLTIIKLAAKNTDISFNRAVNHEYYLTADIYHHVLKADPNDARTLYLTIVNSGEPDVKTRQVAYLLQKGANPNHISDRGSPDMRTPISAASHQQERHLLPLLLKHCHKVISMDGSLKYLVRDGDTDTLRLLLKHGAEVNIPDSNGKTALHQATEPQHGDEAKALEIAELLLQEGAAVNAVYLTHYPPFARTALDMAEEDDSFPAMAELLRRHGAKHARELVEDYYSKRPQ